MLGKKLAADELEDDQTVLPLDNLNDTIQARDALFSPWPKANVVIGNPPYLGPRKMVEELGLSYSTELAKRYPEVSGVSDFVTYWFPLTHRHLPEGGRAGLVATQAIRDASSRKASLDYVVDNGGVIIDAVSSQPWSGDAVVHVSIVNWVKGEQHAPAERILWIDDGELRLPVDYIPPSLKPTTDVAKAVPLVCNKRPQVCFQGQTTGYVEGFRLSRDQALALIKREREGRTVIHPLISGDPLISKLVPNTYVIDVPDVDLLAARARIPAVMDYLEEKALPNRRQSAEKKANRNAELLAKNSAAKPVLAFTNFLNKSWWRHWRRRDDMLEAISKLDRYIALTIVAAKGRMSIYQFVDKSIRPDASLQVFTIDDDYSFGVLSSTLHRKWFDERCSKLKVDPRYTPTTVWNTFPWPLPNPEQVARIAGASASILKIREKYLGMGITLAQQYDGLRTPGKSALRDLHDELDEAVLDADGFSSEDDLLAQLLALNLAAAQEPGAIRRPGGSHLPGAYTSTYRLIAPPLSFNVIGV